MLLPHRIQNRTLRGIGEIRPSEMCRTTRAEALGGSTRQNHGVVSGHVLSRDWFTLRGAW